MAENDINLGIETDVDEADATRQADRLRQIFEKSFAESDIGAVLARNFVKAFKIVDIGDGAFDGFVAGTEKVRQKMREASQESERVGRAFNDLGEAGQQAFRKVNADELNKDLEALAKRVLASKQILEKLGANPDLFAVIDRELKRVLERLRDFEQNAEKITGSATLFQGFIEETKESRRIISGELDLTTRAQINFKDRAAQIGRDLLQEKKMENSRYVVETQGANAQILADTRISGQQQIQADRQRSRTRIELLRFTFRQVQVLERGIAGVFRASGTIANSAARTVSSGINRIGGLFSRSNRDINDGLNGALIQRERSIDRSFERQTSQIRSSIREQSAIIDRFEKQASTGIIGAATGRSRIGGFVGAGAGIGGGFVLAQKLREGFQETVNLNEALNATRLIFGSASTEVIKFSEDSVEALFTTQSAALKAAQNFGIFGKSAQLSGKELSDYSNELTLLATDLASFFNTDVEQATTAISAALRGESEPIRNYGVLLDVATLEQRAFSEGITETLRKLTPQERVLAATAEIFRQTADAQGDAARTADDFANSSKRAGAAVTTLFAAIVENVIPIAEVITNRALPALTALTKFIQGDTSPALSLLRDGLIGASAALAGLLAARIAGEAIQFLALALRAAVTPLGLLIVGVAAAGAAIRIFSARSERFAAVIAAVRDGLRTLVGRGLDLAVVGLAALGNLLTNVVVPAFVRFANAVRGPLIRGLEIVVGVVVGVVIPAFARLVDFLVGTVYPAIVGFGTAAFGVLRSIGRFLSPVIDGFRNLGAIVAVATIALAGLFALFLTGNPIIAAVAAITAAVGLLYAAFNTDADFGGILEGIRTAASGVLDVLTTLASRIYDVLRPQIERAVGFISEAFNNIDFTAIVFAIAKVVRTVGFVLGRIVSDPLFIQALEAIVKVAILLGGNFIIGFGQGVIHNLPALGRLLGDRLQTTFSAAIGFAFNNPTVIGKIILAALAGQAVLSAFNRAGAAGAGGMARGFASGLRKAPGRARDTALGLFGGQGSLNDALARTARISAEKTHLAFTRKLRDISRLGGSTTGLFPKDGIIRESDVRSATRRLDTLRSGIGQVTADAALFRSRTREAFVGVTGGVGELARAVTPGLTGTLTGARSKFGDAFTAIGDGFRRAAAQGRISGQNLGISVLAGFGAIVSGRQAGDGNLKGGVTGILVSAIGAGLATNSPAVAGAVAGAGVIAFAIQSVGRAAREEAEKVQEFTDSFVRLRDEAARVDFIAEELTSQISDKFNDAQTNLLSGLGTGGLTDLSQDLLAGSVDAEDVLRRITEEAGVSKAATSDFIRSLGDDLDLINKGVLGSSFQPFLKLDETLAAEAAYDAYAQALENAGVKVSDLDKVLGVLLGSNDAVASAVLRATVVNDALGESAQDAAAKQVDASGRVTEAVERVRAEFDAGLPDLFRTGGGGIEDQVSALDQVLGPLGFTFESLQDTVTDFSFDDVEIQGFLDSLGLPPVLIDKIVDALGYLKATLEGLDFSSYFDGFFIDLPKLTSDILAPIDAVRRFSSATITQGTRVSDSLGEVGDEAQEAAREVDLIGPAIAELNQQRTSRIQNEIDGIRSRLDDAQEAAERARESLTAFITGRYADTAAASVDDLIGNIGSIGSAIEDAMIQGGVRGDAALRSAVGGFEGQLAGIIQAGFDDGLRTQAQFANLLAPLRAALGEEVGDSASRILSTTEFEFGISPEAGEKLREALGAGPVELDEFGVSKKAGASVLDSLGGVLAGNQIEVNAGLIVNAEAEVARLEAALSAQQARLDVDVIFSTDQIRAALAAAGASAALLAGVDSAAVSAAQLTGLPAAVQQGQTVATENAAKSIIINDYSTTTIPISSGNISDIRTAREVVLAQGAASTGRTINRYLQAV